MKKLIALLLALVMVIGLIACGNTNVPDDTKAPDGTKAPAGNNDPAPTDAPVVDPMAPYAETVKFTVGKSGADPEILKDNAYKDWLCEKLNIDWSWYYENLDAAAYEDQIDLATISGEMPDMMFVDDDHYFDMVEAGLVADLTEFWNELASDELKALYDGYSIYGEDVIGRITVDGKIYGIPHTTTESNHSLSGVWVRQDWLDTLGIDADPDDDYMMDLDDLERVAAAFKEADLAKTGNAEGFCMLPWTGLGAYFSPPAVTRAYGLNHLNFYYDENGVPYYGGFGDQKNGEKALQWWADMYKKGLVDPDFISTEWTDDSLNAQYASGRCGIIFMMNNAPASFFSGVYVNDANAKFSFFGIEGADGKAAHYGQNPDDIGYVMVVRKDFSNPELLIKLLNAREEVYADYDLYKELCGDSNPKSLGPVSVNDNEANETGKLYGYINDFLTGKITLDEVPARYQARMEIIVKAKEDFSSLTPAERAQYDYLTSGCETTGKLVELGLCVAGSPAIADSKLSAWSATFADIFYADLYPLEDEFLCKVITGEKAVADWFGEFQELWLKNGGQTMMDEIIAGAAAE